MSTFRHHSLPPVTVTLTDIVFATIDPRTTTSTSHNTVAAAPPPPTPPTPHQQHDRWIHQLLPVLGVFAVIGLLAILAILGFLAYRFYRSDGDNDNRGGGSRRRRRRAGEQEMGTMPLWATAPGAGGDDPAKSPGLTRFVRKWHPPPHAQGMQEHDPSVISRTFVPMDTSPMTLVPRSEVLRDPARRRGIDALDLWEQKHQVRYPSSASSSETVQVSPRRHQQPDDPSTAAPSASAASASSASSSSPSHVAMARQALEKSRLENSSSQWFV